MTRYTNVGRKRTYLQASFDPNDDQIASNVVSTSSPRAPDATRTLHENSVDAPAESSRKRPRRSKESSEEKVAAEPGSAAVAGDGSGKIPQNTKSERKKKALAKLKAKEKAKRRIKTAADRAASSEARRLKRTAGRQAHTTCFACREIGHSAKDCPTMTIQRPENASNRGGGGETEMGTSAAVRVVVGICYRCGSRKHNLARCPQPAKSDGSLPFASCFVCSGRGHLAGSCPQNNGKGVYPNGGSCKLCGETTHLAKDCALRKSGGSGEGSAVAMLLGTDREGAADEDDFHSIRRKNAEMDRDERGEERVRREAKVRAGALTGIVKAFGKAPAKPKKVVHF